MKSKNKKDLFQNFWHVLKLNWKIDPTFFVITLVLTIVGGLIPLGMSYAFKLVLDSLVKSRGIAAVPVALIGYLAFRYLLSVLADFQRTYQYDYIQRIVRFKSQNYLDYEICKKVSLLDIKYFEDPEIQNLIEKVRQGSFGRVSDYSNEIFFILSSATTFIGAFISLLQFGWWIPLVPVLAAAPRFYVDKVRAKFEWSIFNNKIPESRELNYLSRLLQNAEPVKEIKIFGTRDALLKRYKKLQDHLYEKAVEPLHKYLRSQTLPIVVESVIIFVLIYLKLPAVLAGLISVGSLSFYVQMLDRVLDGTSSVSGHINRMSENNLYVTYYFDLLGMEPLIQDPKPGYTFDEIAPPKIEFQNISFSYEKDRRALRNITFTISPGEHLAIVGPNGAGKSTLIKVLLRFYDPTQGQVLINDVNLKEIPRPHWYKFVGTLFQDFMHYSLSVKDNILLGDPRTIDENKMRESARLSGADEFIEQLPKKYNQRLGRQFEDGKELSTGQWQKLALARAFYESAPVLILDEPTSAIDAEAEASIFENLNKVYKNKTLIFVSHRFSTVRNADKIIVLRNGSVVENGNHESLIKLGGVYARMFNKQAEGYID